MENLLINKKFICIEKMLLSCFLIANFFMANVHAFDIEQSAHVFDLEATDSNSLSLPSDVVVSTKGKIYVVDSGNHRIVIFKVDGTFEKTIGSKGSSQGQFLFPTGIGIDTAGSIYIADSGNNRIQIFTEAGQFVRQFAVLENNKEIRPIDVAVSPDRKIIYVTGNTNHKVMTYNPQGNLLALWGGEGNHTSEFRYPATLVTGKNGDVYVIDVFNSRVQVFNSKGTFQSVISSWGVLPGQLFRPKGVAIDSDENIYISDSYLDVVEIFNRKFKYKALLGSEGKPVKLYSPTGMTIDNKNRIYICEMLGHKVSVYQLGQTEND